MKTKSLFIAFLAIQTIILIAYTVIAFQNDGINLLQIFINNLTSLTWNGQFNLDFSSYLVCSGLWIIWRNQFTTSSFILALLAAIVGFMILAPYLLFLLQKEKGDIKTVLVGKN